MPPIGKNNYKRMKIPVSFCIPCFNDESTIEKAVREADSVGVRSCTKYEILVIDDRSRDGSLAILQKLAKSIPQLTVISHTVNLGYGGTIKELYYRARCEWLFTIPGDYQIGAVELNKLIPYSNRADMIIGWRTRRIDPKERLRQSKIYNILLRLLFGLTIHDVNSVRLMKTVILKKITLKSKSAFVDAELVLRAKKADFRIAEAPIAHRGQENRGGGGNLKTIIPTVIDLLRFRLGLL